ncbi:MAG: GNAT family N-acetyltransferase [Xanthobacteraceae bacterium]
MTYAIARYPVHLIDIVRVANGRRVTIRPTLPQDLELQQEFFRSLSAEGRYRRFMTPVNELPEAVAQRFVSVDYRNHLALLAEVFEDSREIMIGEARYVIEQRDPATCEFAIAVADDWHANGIGRALLARLEREAITSGIQRIFADTLYDNKAMLGLAARSGYAIRMNPGDARLVRLEKKLSVSTASPTVRPLAA